jgi:hypothetical protein
MNWIDSVRQSQFSSREFCWWFISKAMPLYLPSFATICPNDGKAMAQFLFDEICHLSNHVIIQIGAPRLKQKRISISINRDRWPSLYCSMKQSIASRTFLMTLLNQNFSIV